MGSLAPKARPISSELCISTSSTNNLNFTGNVEPSFFFLPMGGSKSEGADVFYKLEIVENGGSTGVPPDSECHT